MGDGRCGSLLLWIANCEAFETRRLQLVADAAAEVGTIGWLVGRGAQALLQRPVTCHILATLFGIGYATVQESIRTFQKSS